MLRSFLRDILCIYIGYKLLMLGLFGHEMSSPIILGILLLLFTIWFLFEKIGILPKITG